jgi:hypothetical protein
MGLREIISKESKITKETMTEQEICKACGTGNKKHKHNYDTKTCRYGRLQALSFLTEKEQVEALRAEERFSLSMAEMIVGLAKERKKSILEVMQEEQVA